MAKPVYWFVAFVVSLLVWWGITEFFIFVTDTFKKMLHGE